MTGKRGKEGRRGKDERRKSQKEEWLHLLYGVPRPAWLEFPRDKNTYEMEEQFMVGGSLMVKPVTDQYATSVQLYLPGSNSVSWCQLDVCFISLETYDSPLHFLTHTCTHTHTHTHTHTQIWYDYEDYTPYSGGSRYSVSAPLSKASPTLQTSITVTIH